jgi:hypothetical protein
MRLNPERAYRTVSVGRGRHLKIYSDGEITLFHGVSRSGEWLTRTDIEARWPHVVAAVDAAIHEMMTLARSEQQ